MKIYIFRECMYSEEPNTTCCPTVDCELLLMFTCKTLKDIQGYNIHLSMILFCILSVNNLWFHGYSISCEEVLVFSYNGKAGRKVFSIVTHIRARLVQGVP